MTWMWLSLLAIVFLALGFLSGMILTWTGRRDAR